mgnify:CR=1 FL=1
MTEKEFKEKLNRDELKLIKEEIVIVPLERIYTDVKTGEYYRVIYDVTHVPIIKIEKINLMIEEIEMPEGEIELKGVLK